MPGLPPLPCNRCPTCLHLLPVTPPARAGHSLLHGTLQIASWVPWLVPPVRVGVAACLPFSLLFFYFGVLFLLPFPPCPQPRVLWVFFFFFFFFLFFFLPRKT